MENYELNYADGLFTLNEINTHTKLYAHEDVKQVAKYLMWTLLEDKYPRTSMEETIFIQLGDTMENSMHFIDKITQNY